MRTPFLLLPAALVAAVLSPGLSDAQRIGRTVVKPPVVALPATPAGSSSGATVFRGAYAAPRRVPSGATGATIGRTYLPRREPRTETGVSGGFRSACVGGHCRCFGGWRCGRASVSVIPFGFSLFESYAVPYAVPYPVPYPVASAFTAPGPRYAQREREAEAPTRRPAPGKSRMIVVDTSSSGRDRSVDVEMIGDSSVRLTWIGTPVTASSSPEAQLIIADSARRTLGSVRVDVASPAALIDVRAFRRRMAYAGVSVELPHGTILTTLVPLVAERRASTPSPPR